jgi:hypothetical protein
MKLRNLAPLSLLLLAATASADTAVYDLDAKNAKEIADALGRVLEGQCKVLPSNVQTTAPGMCKVELLPTGQLLVGAPAALQAQVASVVKAIAARDAAPAPRVTVQYWVIYGAPGKPSAADASLQPLDAVVQQLERTHAGLGFSVLDSTSLVTQSGSSGSAHGGSLNIDQTVRASVDDLALSAQIGFARRPVIQSLNVNVTIKRGEFVVLGERTAEPGQDESRKDEPDKGQKSGMVFFVVHWQ